MGHYASEMGINERLSFDEETQLYREQEKRQAELFKNIDFGYLINIKRQTPIVEE